MNAAGLAIALGVAVGIPVAGCGHYPEILRLRNEFEEQIRLGHDRSAADTERRLRDLLALDYEPNAPFAILQDAEIGELHGYWGQPARARAMLQQSIDRIEASADGGELRTLAPRLASAWTLVFERRWAEAEQRADDIAAICHRHEQPWFARGPCGDELLRLYMETGACRKAAAEFLRNDSDSVLGEDRRSGVSSVILLGRRYVECGALPEARWYLNVCADEARGRSPSGSSSQTVWTSAAGDVALAFVDSAHAFESQAPRCLEDLIPLERLVGHGERSQFFSRWQRDLWRSGPDLEQELRERVRFTHRAWRSDILTADELNTLAWYYRGKERNADAIATWRDASQKIDRLVARYGRYPSGSTEWRHTDILQGLAAACEDTGDLSCAEASWKRASILAETGRHPSHAWRLDTLAGLGRTQLRLGQAAAAETTWKRFLEIAAEQRGNDHAEFARGLSGLADAREAAGDPTEARLLRTRAASVLAAYRRRVDAVRELPLPVALRSPPSPAN